MTGNRQEFERDLEAIEGKVIELFAMMAEDLPKATSALLSGGDDAVLALGPLPTLALGDAQSSISKA